MKPILSSMAGNLKAEGLGDFRPGDPDYSYPRETQLEWIEEAKDDFKSRFRNGFDEEFDIVGMIIAYFAASKNPNPKEFNRIVKRIGDWLEDGIKNDFGNLWGETNDDYDNANEFVSDELDYAIDEHVDSHYWDYFTDEKGLSEYAGGVPDDMEKFSRAIENKAFQKELIEALKNTLKHIFTDMNLTIKLDQFKKIVAPVKKVYDRLK